MELPKAEDLRAIFAAARENGLTHFRFGGLEFKLAPAAPVPVDPQALIAEINRTAPIPAGDPIEEIRRQLGITTRTIPGGGGADGDPLEAIASGRPLVRRDDGDPTQPARPAV